MLGRRAFVGGSLGTAVALSIGRMNAAETAISSAPRVTVSAPEPGEDLFAYIHRKCGAFDAKLYHQILGAANEFKEGDLIVGVAAADDASRKHARALLGNTRLEQLDAHPLAEDELHKLSQRYVSLPAAAKTAPWKLSELQQYLLRANEDEIKSIMGGLSSDVIGCVVKLLSNAELIAVGSKVFNPLPGSQIGARGYLGARIQPNSPTDNVSDIQWQVFDGWSYAVGDVVLGNNPVSSDPSSVAAIERTLFDLLKTFGLQEVLPHCVLSHIDVQAAVERADPGSTGIWFQSIAGSDAANTTFDISVEKMVAYAKQREGQFGLYFETGQGADFTNGHARGYDMVLHESRKYGFARALTHCVKETLHAPWQQILPMGSLE